MTSGDALPAPATVFHDLDHYVAVPRLSGLSLSRDGARLVTSVSTLDPKGTSHVSALWEVDPAGERTAYRLTRSAKGETGATFAHNGDLYFTSARPDPDGKEGEEPTSALWRIPAVGGEARVVLSRPGGVGAVMCARDADTTVVSAGLLAGARTETEHRVLSKIRKDSCVDAVLHDGYPIRFWDHDLGPQHPSLFVAEPDPDADTPLTPTTVDHQDPLRLRMVSEGLGRALEEQTPAVSPDGTFALVPVTVFQERGDQHTALVRIDLASGERRVVLDDPDREFFGPVISPDSRRAVVVSDRKSTPERAPHPQLSVLDLDSGELSPSHMPGTGGPARSPGSRTAPPC